MGHTHTGYSYALNGTRHNLTQLKDIVNPSNPSDPLNVVRTTYQYTAGSGGANDRVNTVTDRDGAQTSISYATSSTGLATTMTRSAAGVPNDVMIDHYRKDTTFEYAEHNGQLVSYQTFGAGLAATTQVDGQGTATLIDRDTTGMPTRASSNGLSARWTYREDHRLTTMVSTEGMTTTYAYDGGGNVTGITHQSADGTPMLTETATYDGSNRVVDRWDSASVRTQYTYTTDGQLATQTVGFGTSLARTTAFSYDSFGRQTDVIEASGTALARQTHIVYTGNGTIQSVTQNYKNGSYDSAKPDEDLVTTYGYDTFGRPVTTTDPDGHVQATHYDTQGRVDWTVANLVEPSGTALTNATTGQPNFVAFAASAPDRNVATLYSYDGLGRVDLVTQTGILTGTFDTISMTFSSATTRATKTIYDSQNRPTETIANYTGAAVDVADDHDLRELTYYNGTNQPTWTRDALGRWTNYVYDGLGRSIRTVQNYENGNPTTIDTANASWATPTDNDLITATTYDAIGRATTTIRHKDADTDTLPTAYDPAHPHLNLVDSASYDGLGRVTDMVQNVWSGTSGASDTNLTSATAYDPLTGRVQGQQDALGRWTALVYDALGHVVTQVRNCHTSASAAAATNCGALTHNPTQPTTSDWNVASTTIYDALGQVIETGDAIDQRTRVTLDGMGRTTQVIAHYVSGTPTTSDTNVTTSRTYDALGRVVSTTDATGTGVTTYAYDGLGRISQVTDPASRITRSGADQTGSRWTKTADGRFTVTLVDGLGRPTKQIVNYTGMGTVVAGTTPTDQNVTTSTIYDAAGRAIQTTDAIGHVTRYTYDLRDNLTNVIANVATTCSQLPCNVTTTYAYDLDGNRISITDPLGHSQSWVFDESQRVSRATDGLGVSTDYTYDRGDRMTGQSDPRGASWNTTYTYSDLDQLLRIAEADGQTTHLNPITMAYDAQGWRTVLNDGTGTTSFTPDALGRITAVNAPTTGSVSYRYNARGDRTALTYPNGTSINYSYKPDGQLDQVLQGGTVLATYGYDSVGRFQQLQRANGATTTYGYDGADRLNTLLTTVGGSMISQYTYTLDRQGQRTQVAETRPEQIGLVADSQSGSAGSNPSSGVTIGTTWFFSADDGSHGSELWKSDGTSAGTGLVKDTWPGSNGGGVGTPTAVNATLFFSANDGTNGIELWKSDGTAAGTVLVKDLWPGSNHALPSNLTVVNGTLYFTANNGTTGIELWKSDGTAAGTVVVKDILSGSGSSAPQYLTAVNGTLFFTATDGTNGTELWKSDGTSSGTTLVKDIRSGSSSLPTNLTAVGSTLFFSATDGTNGTELWKSDGTPAGTVRVKDIRSGSSSSSPNNLATMNGSLFFCANDGTNGYELWKSDGTAAGTVLVKDVWSGSGGSSPANLTVVNGTLFFAAFDGATGYELWKSDGTATGTVLVKDIVAGFGSANPSALTAVNNRLSFKANDGTHGTELWVSDGTATGTAFVADTQPGSGGSTPTNLQASAGRLFLSADDGVHGQELWSIGSTTHTVTYAYDGLQRLSGAQETGASTNVYSYTYDLAGNRTSATLNGVTTARSYNAANQVSGLTYDAVGNLLNDGTTAYGYDALNRQTNTGSTTNTYNGDGTLVQQGATRYTQDLIAPLSQILSDGTQTFVYGRERLYGQAGTTKTWYGSDALGSVRYTMDATGTPSAPITYDPWGAVTSGNVPTFGFTGELQQGGLVHLRARWYSTGEGRFGSRDSALGQVAQPYSYHPYQYGYANPVMNGDPTGKWCVHIPGTSTGIGTTCGGSSSGFGDSEPPVGVSPVDVSFEVMLGDHEFCGPPNIMYLSVVKDAHTGKWLLKTECASSGFVPEPQSSKNIFQGWQFDPYTSNWKIFCAVGDDEEAQTPDDPAGSIKDIFRDSDQIASETGEPLTQETIKNIQLLQRSKARTHPLTPPWVDAQIEALRRTGEAADMHGEWMRQFVLHDLENKIALFTELDVPARYLMELEDLRTGMSLEEFWSEYYPSTPIRPK